MSREPGYSVDVRERLSYREWAEEYLLKGRPVVIRDAMPEWRAMTQWTPELLTKTLGNKQVRIGPDMVPFDELTEQILASTDEQPGPYLRNLDIANAMPEIADDVLPRFRYAQPNWKASRLMPRDWIFPDELVELFYGGQGTRFPQLHQDWWGMHVFLTQIYGKKRAMLCPPEDRPYLYPTTDNTLFSGIDDVENPDPARYPLFERAHPTWLTLTAGDSLFVPPGWWHATKMAEVSITVITVNWNRSNWSKFMREVVRTKLRGAPLKTAGTVGYMASVGAVLSARDRLRGWP